MDELSSQVNRLFQQGQDPLEFGCQCAEGRGYDLSGTTPGSDRPIPTGLPEPNILMPQIPLDNASPAYDACAVRFRLREEAREERKRAINKRRYDDQTAKPPALPKASPNVKPSVPPNVDDFAMAQILHEKSKKLS